MTLFNNKKTMTVILLNVILTSLLLFSGCEKKPQKATQEQINECAAEFEKLVARNNEIQTRLVENLMDEDEMVEEFVQFAQKTEDIKTRINNSEELSKTEVCSAIKEECSEMLKKADEMDERITQRILLKEEEEKNKEETLPGESES